MRKYLLLTSLFILLGSVCELQAQEKDPGIIIQKSNSIRFSKVDNTTILEGNVSISTGKLEVANADKIIIEKGTNKVLVYGSCEFTFSGKLVKTSRARNVVQVLEYTVGEDSLYLK